MASPITPSTGLGSGLAIGEIVSALVTADSLAKTTQISTQTKLVTTKLSGIGTLQSAMDAFQAAMKKLGDKTTPAFAGYAATSSKPDAMTVSSDNSAVPGTYNIAVTNIATSSKVASAAFKDGATSAILSGEFSITQNDITTKIDVPEGSTLQSLAKQINAKSSTTNISANIITDSNGSRLVLGSTATGAGTEITAGGITGLTIGGGKLDTTDSTSSGYLGSIPKDAVFSIDGMEITSPTNAIKGALGGVSMTLLADNSTSTITVATNTDGLKTSLQSFVDSYNAVVKAIATVTKATVSDTPDPTTGATVTPAALTGDSMPRSILAAMRKELVTGAGGTELSVLSQLGINTGQTDGMLSLDSTKFEKAMSTGNLGGQVQQLFSGTDSTNGLLSRMTAALNPYTETGGILDTRTSSLNKQSSDLQNQKTALDLRVATMTATLTAKYNAMDLLVGQLKASATSITSFFDTLNAQQSS